MLRVERARGDNKNDQGEIDDALREAEAKILPPDARKAAERRLGTLAQAMSMINQIDDVLGNYDTYKQAAGAAPDKPHPKHPDDLDLLPEN